MKMQVPIETRTTGLEVIEEEPQEEHSLEDLHTSSLPASSSNLLEFQIRGKDLEWTWYLADGIIAFKKGLCSGTTLHLSSLFDQVELLGACCSKEPTWRA